MRPPAFRRGRMLLRVGASLRAMYLNANEAGRYCHVRVRTRAMPFDEALNGVYVSSAGMKIEHLAAQFWINGNTRALNLISCVLLYAAHLHTSMS